jgi:hypothetical protein
VQALRWNIVQEGVGLQPFALEHGRVSEKSKDSQKKNSQGGFIMAGLTL